MATMKDLGRLIDQMRHGILPPAELRSRLTHKSPMVRANALEALVASSRNDQESLNELIAAATNPSNAFQLMGTISVAHVAVACLLRVGTPKAVSAANEILAAWVEPDRTDLIRYVESEGLKFGGCPDA